MTDYYAEITVVQRHIVQFKADSYEEAMEELSKGRPDNLDIQVLDTDKPMVLVEDFGENEDGPFMTAGDPFGAVDEKWVGKVENALIRMVAKRAEGK